VENARDPRMNNEVKAGMKSLQIKNTQDQTDSLLNIIRLLKK
jgi:hypothetical protein